MVGEAVQDGDDLTSGCEGVLAIIQKQDAVHSFAGVQSGSSVTAGTVYEQPSCNGVRVHS